LSKNWDKHFVGKKTFFALFAYGHPLVGDNLYSTKKTREQNRKINLGRIFLVASKLSFTDLAGKKQTFSVEMPEDLADFLSNI
jgi:hypothetical protein